MEEWARAFCTESAPAELAVELDVPGGNGKLCLDCAGLNMVFASQPSFQMGLQEQQRVPVSLFPCFLQSSGSSALHKALPWELFRTGEWWQGDSGRVPMYLVQVCGFGVSVLQEGPVPPMAQPSTDKPSSPE